MFPIKSSQFWGLIPYFKICVVDTNYVLSFFPILVDYPSYSFISSSLLLISLDIHPASRGVAAHTASLFRSVRGAKGGFPPWGLPKLGNFHFSPRGGSPS